ncbi:uncharacterized protein PHALS_12975 [Plasmopara halstedii]|uniref:Uncharacterized protein n=1 Tax=Plasmopara halstedii TaxID=4781 RepID=A0A0N7L5X9_PLAHL|nr:uncharacterized protein PHALS_12975 [Plasmopara halstedii]CEG42723.1 hypothetical protein PHALS_12975 [Plasmopara halstedii]|eukprot:XP_024579092.1 hypothetical protein PHALS_12975 [Plasmopara halstedii]
MADSKDLEQVYSDLGNVLDRIDSVEKQMSVKLKEVDGPVGGTDLQEFQKEMLVKLRAIRDKMFEEGSSLEQLRKERDMARSERDALVKQVDKLNYRVQHLKQHVSVPSPADMKL